MHDSIIIDVSVYVGIPTDDKGIFINDNLTFDFDFKWLKCTAHLSTFKIFILEKCFYCPSSLFVIE